MKLVDANVLIYAVDKNAPRHVVAHRWLDQQLSSAQTLLMPWISLLAFIRLCTHPSVYEHPMSSGDALDVVAGWLDRPHVVTPEPDAHHARRMRELLTTAGRGGNLVNDAHLAALAIQHRAVVATFDQDFGRFPDIRWETPT